MWIPSAHDLPYLFPKVFTFCNKKEAATGHRASRPLVDGAEGGTEADVEASREVRLGRWRSKRARSRTLREHRTPEAGGDLIGVAVWIGGGRAKGAECSPPKSSCCLPGTGLAAERQCLFTSWNGEW